MRKLLTVLALVAAITSVVAAQVATAGRPAFNPACDGTKIEPVVSGTYEMPFGTEPGSVTITVYDTPAGQLFDFATDAPTHLVGSVVDKGGTAFETWTFDPAVSSATGLHASLNPSSGKWYDASHLCFTTSLGSGGGGGGED
ncbi:MAG: hypothetical protein U0R50_14520 [Gaiellales bacterium]